MVLLFSVWIAGLLVGFALLFWAATMNDAPASRLSLGDLYLSQVQARLPAGTRRLRSPAAAAPNEIVRYAR
jgi:hypothetical protein